MSGHLEKMMRRAGLMNHLDRREASSLSLFPQVTRAKTNENNPMSPRNTVEDVESDKTGIRVSNWFYASEVYDKIIADKKAKEKAPPPRIEPALEENPAPLTNPEPDADQQALQLLIKNPNMNAATFLNTLKSNGLSVYDNKKAIESATPIRENNLKTTLNCTFMERVAPDAEIHTGASKFRVALIQEGLGNLRDAFYYTRQALESAVPAFEGKKCYADHPSRTDEVDRPERSIRDIVGHFEDVHIEENADGSAMLCADLVMVPDEPFEWARSLVRHAIIYSKSYPDKEFVGLSINAAGDAEPMEAASFIRSGMIPNGAKTKILGAIEQGLTQVRVVSAIHDAVSTDLVTEPGAKGKVLEIIESEKGKQMAKKENEKKEDGMEKKEAAVEAAVESKEAKEADDHSDASQDKKLIMDMIKKHMGGDNATDSEDEAMKCAHEAYEAYKEMGMDEKEAAKHAAGSMRLARKMAQKQAMKHEAEKQGSILPKENDMEPKEANTESKEAVESKESDVITLSGRVAFLESELKKKELAEYLDTKLKESKLDRSATDEIRKIVGEPKSEKDIDKTITIFTEAYKAAGGSRSESKSKPSSMFVTSVEKNPSISAGKSKLDFADCKNK